MRTTPPPRPPQASIAFCRAPVHRVRPSPLAPKRVTSSTDEPGGGWASPAVGARASVWAEPATTGKAPAPTPAIPRKWRRLPPVALILRTVAGVVISPLENRQLGRHPCAGGPAGGEKPHLRADLPEKRTAPRTRGVRVRQ